LWTWPQSVHRTVACPPGETTSWTVSTPGEQAGQVAATRSLVFIVRR